MRKSEWELKSFLFEWFLMKFLPFELFRKKNSRKLSYIWNSNLQNKLFSVGVGDWNQDRQLFDLTLVSWQVLLSTMQGYNIGRSSTISLTFPGVFFPWSVYNYAPNSMKNKTIFSFGNNEIIIDRVIPKNYVPVIMLASLAFVIVNIFLRNHVFFSSLVFQTTTNKNFLANLHFYFFQYLRVSNPGEFPHQPSRLFQASWYRHFLV